MALQLLSEHIGDKALKIQCEFHHPAEKVFRAWTEDEHWVKWMCPDEDARVELHEFDCLVGGGYDLSMIMDDGTYRVKGVYQVVEPSSQLVMTWEWHESENSPGVTLLTVDFEPIEEGCRMTLTHEKFVSSEVRGWHVEGWESCLGRLFNHLDGNG